MTDHHDHHGCHERSVFTRGELSRRAAAQAAQRVQLPEELLDAGASSFFDGGSGITRKQLLARSGGLLLGLAAASRLSPLGMLEQAAAAADPRAPILVTIYLGGGNDGLNTLVPLAGADRSKYEELRSHTKLAPEELLPVTGRDDLGWHPAATGLKALHDAGQLVAITGVDYPDPSMSHFESAHNWRTGSTDPQQNLGWLGRYLDHVGTGNPLEGIAVQWGGDGALQGARAATATVHDPGDYGIWSPGVWNGDRMAAAWARMGAPAKSPAYKRSIDVVRQTYATAQALKPLAAQKAEDLPAPPMAYADNDAGKELRTLGRLLGAGLGTRVATLQDSGEYDTHDSQPDRQKQNLAELGQNLQAWQADLAQRGLADRVITLVWSEFGRRAEDNDSAGTDHGAGGLLFVLGTRARGGVLSQGWGLSALNDDGNLQVTTDFRDVYAGLLEGHLKIGARDVLPGYAGTPLALVA